MSKVTLIDLDFAVFSLRFFLFNWVVKSIFQYKHWLQRYDCSIIIAHSMQFWETTTLTFSMLKVYSWRDAFNEDILKVLLSGSFFSLNSLIGGCRWDVQNNIKIVNLPSHRYFCFKDKIAWGDLWLIPTWRITFWLLGIDPDFAVGIGLEALQGFWNI